MLVDELHQRYGQRVAARLQEELTSIELDSIESADLLQYLETRAQLAHKEYLARLENPFISGDIGNMHVDHLDLLYRRWRWAEELAYLVDVAEDAGTSAVAGGKK